MPGLADIFSTKVEMIDYVIIGVYFAFVLGIGFALKKFMRSSKDFLESGRSIPAWITGLAFISTNLGALEVMGMGASGAKYGIATCHFYWVGAIPAMVFLGVFMMPFYYGSKARSVPEYLKLRFDEKTRAFNAFTFAVMTIFASGISMYAMAKLMQVLLGWNFHFSIVLSAVIVLVYTFLGGLTSAIYNEVLQFFLIVAGLTPVVFLGLKDAGGWQGVVDNLHKVATGKGFAADAWTRSWGHMDTPSGNPMGIEWFGLVMGLGFVLSFGYWCTNFLVVQRAMAAESMSAARRTPLIGAIPKMFIPILVILPGMIAISVAMPAGALSTDSKAVVEKYPLAKTDAKAETKDATKEAKKEVAPPNVQELMVLAKEKGKGLIPPKIDESTQEIKVDKKGNVEMDYNMAIPMQLFRYLPTGLLGLGLCALLASFMSGMAGNVTAFNTVWTYDIYQSYIKPGQSDAHYLRMGHMATIFGTLVSIAAAYLAAGFDNIMDFLQLVFGFVNAPLFATFLLGMFWKRTNSKGAFTGLVLGTFSAALVYGLTVAEGKGGWFGKVHEFPSSMAQNFWLATIAFSVCFVISIVVSLATARDKNDEDLKGLVYSLTPKYKDLGLAWYKQPATLGVIVMAVAIVLNIIFW